MDSFLREAKEYYLWLDSISGMYRKLRHEDDWVGRQEMACCGNFEFGPPPLIAAKILSTKKYQNKSSQRKLKIKCHTN